MLVPCFLLFHSIRFRWPGALWDKIQNDKKVPRQKKLQDMPENYEQKYRFEIVKKRLIKYREMTLHKYCTDDGSAGVALITSD